mgnify:CR=1 FL=1
MITEISSRAVSLLITASSSLIMLLMYVTSYQKKDILIVILGITPLPIVIMIQFLDGLLVLNLVILRIKLVTMTQTHYIL